MRKEGLRMLRTGWMLAAAAATGIWAQTLPKNVTAVEFYDVTKPGLSFAVDKQSVVGMYEVPGKPEHFLVLGYFGYVWSLYPDLGKNYAPGAIKDYSKRQLADFNRLVRKGWEQGALGASFDPDFSENRYFYIIYNKYDKPEQYHGGLVPVPAQGDGPGSSGLIVVERWKLSQDLQALTRDTTIFSADHGTGYGSANLVFGKDGYMYITADSYSRNSWDSTEYMRKILRIDVSRQDPGKMYAIPPTNPWVGSTNPNVKKEVFAFGLRNTYSLAADYLTGSVWGAEVGQSTWEEVNILKPGRNYGWADGGDGQRLPNGDTYRFGVGIEGPCSEKSANGGAFNGTTGYRPKYSFSGPQSFGRTYTCADFENGTWNFSHPGEDLDGQKTAVKNLKMNCIILGPAFRGDPSSPFYGYHFVTDVARNYFVAVKEGVAQADSVGSLPSKLRFTGDVNHNGITSFAEDSYGNLYATMLASSASGAFAWHDIYRLSSPQLKPLSVPRGQVVPTRASGPSAARPYPAFHRRLVANGKKVTLEIPMGFSRAEVYDMEGRLLGRTQVEPRGADRRVALPGIPESSRGLLGVRFLP